MTYSYMSTGSKLANKCKIFYLSHIFFLLVTLQAAGAQLKKQNSIPDQYLPLGTYHYSPQESCYLQAQQQRQLGGKCPLAVFTSCYGAPIESQLGNRMQCNACLYKANQKEARDCQHYLPGLP